MVDFVAKEVTRACQNTCNVKIENVSLGIFTQTNIGSYRVSLRVWMLHEAGVILVQRSAVFSSLASVQRLASAEPRAFDLVDFAVQYIPTSNLANVAVCGDNIVGFGETCDDGNSAAGDGCSQLCVLESGYMCYSSVRSTDATVVGTLVKWDLSTDRGTHSNVLRVLAAPEQCTGGNICQYRQKWQPDIWATVYGNSTPNAALPPAGYYCSRYC